MLKQINSLLSLRAKQAFRYLQEIGFVFIAFAIFILTGIILPALQNMLNAPAYSAIILAIILLAVIEIKRKDNFFLKSIFATKIDFYAYKIIENIIILMPIIAFQGIFERWDIILYVIAICCLMAFSSLYLTQSAKHERKISLNKIPLSIFEIKFYFEKNIWFFGLIWPLLCLGGIHISLWILGMFILCTVPIDIYTPLEPREMVQYRANFVLHKILKSVGFFLISIAGPTLITAIFSPDVILILTYGVVALILSITLSICKKYVAFYGVQEKLTSTTSTMIFVFLMLAPGGILITLSACIYYYFKAEKQMKNIYASL